MREKSLDFLGYPNYTITDDGRIFSLNYNHTGKKKEVKPGILNGYNKITLCKDGVQKCFLVHRLVALSYLPNPDNLPEVNHRDEDKTNNRVDNLEFCDHKYNANYGTIKDRTRNTRLKNGHINEEYSGLDKKSYGKKYYQDHKEERKEYNKKYREEHKEELKEKRKKYYQDCKEEMKK